MEESDFSNGTQSTSLDTGEPLESAPVSTLPQAVQDYLMGELQIQGDALNEVLRQLGQWVDEQAHGQQAALDKVRRRLRKCIGEQLRNQLERLGPLLSTIIDWVNQQITEQKVALSLFSRQLERLGFLPPLTITGQPGGQITPATPARTVPDRPGSTPGTGGGYPAVQTPASPGGPTGSPGPSGKPGVSLPAIPPGYALIQLGQPAQTVTPGAAGPSPAVYGTPSALPSVADGRTQPAPAGYVYTPGGVLLPSSQVLPPITVSAESSATGGAATVVLPPGPVQEVTGLAPGGQITLPGAVGGSGVPPPPSLYPSGLGPAPVIEVVPVPGYPGVWLQVTQSCPPVSVTGVPQTYEPEHTTDHEPQPTEPEATAPESPVEQPTQQAGQGSFPVDLSQPGALLTWPGDSDWRDRLLNLYGVDSFRDAQTPEDRKAVFDSIGADLQAPWKDEFASEDEQRIAYTGAT